ncbi:MAG: hypothetical protein JXC33_10265 [Deltaproteobacteria bacterium]|nr:hypothetical protein [Deltaproteobacteria bacterium]
MASGKFFRTVRIFILLAVLIGVAMGTLATKLRSTSWDDSLWVIIYPMNGDRSEATARYINSLERETFESIEEYMKEEAKKYDLAQIRPITVKMAPIVDKLPPEPPQSPNVLKIIWYSLRLRYWAFMADNYDGPAKDIRMFVLYYDPANHEVLEDSMGLQKGMMGVARAFASWKMESQNNIVITHELLHTVGAADKYDRETGQPIFPEGYADPEKDPLHPQEEAEIMAGRIPMSEIKAEMPKSLWYTVIGPETAREINWIE